MSQPSKVLILSLMVAPLLPAQSPAFEVASVKPAVEPARVPMFCIVPCSPGERVTLTGARVDIRYMSLFNLIVAAYRIKPYQVSGPDWMKSERFDIAATIPADVPKEQLPEMLRSLLAERFKLTIHRDNKEQPVYALVVGKNGSKLQPASATAVAALPDTTGSKDLYTPQGEGHMLDDGGFVVKGGSLGSIRGGRGSSGGMQFEFLELTTAGLAEIVTPHMDRPVVDMTNLKGVYHFMIDMRPPVDGGGGGRKGGPPEAGSDAGPRQDPFMDGLTAALDKAGLKLEKSKAPVDAIVVDHLEKIPTAN